MIEVQESWSIAYLVGWPLWIIGLLVILFLAIACFWAAEGDGMLNFFGVLLSLTFVGLLVLMLSPFGMYPTGGSDYHKWKPKQGVVNEVGKRLLPSGESMQEKIVITFKGDPQEYGVEDTRAALLKPGDQAVIKCKRAYQWGSAHGYDCRFVQRIPAGGAK
jgi:hypothetical protein